VQCIVVVGWLECGIYRKGCTQSRFGILYMNGEVGLGLFQRLKVSVCNGGNIFKVKCPGG